MLSRPRLDKYHTPSSTPRKAVGRYRWNLALCQALYPGLHYLEVAFRNRLHDALKNHFRRALPHMPNHLRKRSEISRRMHTLRLLRNRVFHHEPIWHWTDLAQQYAGLRQALQWLEPQLIGLLHMPHSFEEVYARGPGAHEVEVR